MQSVNDMDSSKNWRWLCPFQFILSQFSNDAKDSEHCENPPNQFQRQFICAHLSSILDRNLHAELWLSCISQMLMDVIFVPFYEKNLFGKRLASSFNIPIADVPNGVSEIFLIHFPDFVEDMAWLKKADSVGIR